MKNSARLHFERAGREHERRERKRRRNQIEHGERDRAFLAHARADAGRRLRGTQRSSPLLADFHAHPERERGAGDRSGGGEQRHDPPRAPHAGGENDDRGVDAEGQREEQRRVERGQDERRRPATRRGRRIQ